jgi:hypothetical protein
VGPPRHVLAAQRRVAHAIEFLRDIAGDLEGGLRLRFPKGVQAAETGPLSVVAYGSPFVVGWFLNTGRG